MAKSKSTEMKQAENELDSLMKRFESGFTGKDAETKEGDVKEPVNATDIDMDELDTKLTIDAKSLISSLYNLYFSAGLIKKNDVLQKKRRIDEMNLSNMFFQIETIKLSIKAAQRIINRGDPHPRMLEAVSDLHVKFADVTKNLANYVLFLEENYRSQVSYIESGEMPMLMEKTEKIAAIAEKGEPEVEVEQIKVTSINNKRLITDSKDLVDEIRNNNEFGVKKKLESKPLTDPFNKEKLAVDLGVDLKKIENVGDYDKLNEEMI